jgi:energy-converting hydrogenase Eha subunit A
MVQIITANVMWAPTVSFDPIDSAAHKSWHVDKMYFMAILVLNLKDLAINFYGRSNRELALEFFVCCFLSPITTFIDIIFSLGQHAIHQRQQAASAGADQTHNRGHSQ